jgi:hypothetical protein
MANDIPLGGINFHILRTNEPVQRVLEDTARADGSLVDGLSGKPGNLPPRWHFLVPLDWH